MVYIFISLNQLNLIFYKSILDQENAHLEINQG